MTLLGAWMRGVVFAIIGLVAPGIARAEAVISLNGGAASITFPWGEPQKINFDAQMQALMRRFMAQLFATGDASSKVASVFDETMTSMSKGEAWMADDGAGDGLSIADFPLPATNFPVQCPTNFAEQAAKSSSDFSASCRVLSLNGRDELELRIERPNHDGVVSRIAVVGGRVYAAQAMHSSEVNDFRKKLGLPPVTPQDGAEQFFESLRFSPPATQ